MLTKKILLWCSLSVALVFAPASPLFAQESAFSSFSDSGMASWFGEWHHGKKTASGEPFDMYAMTAAHRTLPFGTVLQVTYLKTGQEILVRVNDRGPYRQRRILDLSYAAAECLGLRRSGVGKVEITAVGDTSGLPLDADQAFFVRLDPEKADQQDAKRQLAGLVRIGFLHAVELLHRTGDSIALGPFARFQDAQEALSRVATIHPKAAIILVAKDSAEPVISSQAALY